MGAEAEESAPHLIKELMKTVNDNKQMTDVWRLPAIGRWEKSCGKHPTQKPLSVLARIILSSTNENAWVFDPFAGSSTTGIAANLCGRRYCGIEQEEEFCALSKARREELEDVAVRRNLRNHIADFKVIDSFSEDEMPSILRDEYISEYGKLPFD